MRPGPASPEEIAAALERLPGWTRLDEAITREYRFAGFPQAVAFVAGLVAPAEALDHHPDLEIHFRTVRVTLTTHARGCLTALDFRLAAAVDGVARATGADCA